VGGVLSSDPIGRVAARVSAVWLLRLGIVMMAASVIGIGLVRSLVPLILLHGTVGVCTSMLRIGSQLLIRNRVDDDRRGRVHAVQGIIRRVAVLVAPVGVGFAWERFDPEWSFVLATVLTLLVVMLGGSLVAAPPRPIARGDASVTPLLTMLRYGSGPTLFTAARSGRMLVLPLIGLELDLAPSRIGLLVGLTAAADVLTSPASGPLMDGRGRLATIIPSFTLTAAGFLLLGVANGGPLLATAAVVLGLGNGLSSGLLLTLGTDLAPTGNEGPFLGRFGAMHDAGRLIGPFIVGLLGEWLGLNIAAVALAVVTMIGLACLLGFVGETRPVSPVANRA
jgi:MFS family permease